MAPGPDPRSPAQARAERAQSLPETGAVWNPSRPASLSVVPARNGPWEVSSACPGLAGWCHFPAVWLQANRVPSLGLDSWSEKETEDPPPVGTGCECDLYSEKLPAPLPGTPPPSLPPDGGEPSGRACSPVWQLLLLFMASGSDRASGSRGNLAFPVVQGEGGDMSTARGAGTGPRSCPYTLLANPLPPHIRLMSQGSRATSTLCKVGKLRLSEEPFCPKTHI